MSKLLYAFVLVWLNFNATLAQPLRLLPENPHYFEYLGQPLVVVGSGEHYGAVMNLDFDFDKYLASIKADGLNTTRLFMGAYYEKPGAFGIQKNTLAPAEGRLLLPWSKSGDKYDLTLWNEAYFERLRSFMDKARNNGVIVEVNLFSSYYGSGWDYHPFHGNNNVNQTPTDLPSNKVNTLNNGAILKYQETYTRKLARELNAYDNFYFEIQNEPWADGKDTVLVWNDYSSPDEFKQAWMYWRSTLEVPSKASAQWHEAVSGWIADEESKLPKKHLISHNVANFKLPVSLDNPHISIYTFHYAHPEAATINYAANKVIGFNETGFAGRSDDTYRRQAWRFMMNGGGLFNHLDYSFTIGHEGGDETANEAPGGGSAALRKSFAVLKSVLENCNLRTLRPDRSFVGMVEGAFSYSMTDAQSWLVYLEPITPEPSKVQLHLPKGSYTLQWRDTKTGALLKTETYTSNGQMTRLQSPSGFADKILQIRK